MSQEPTGLEPMSAQDLVDVLGLTIKQDEENKLITFLCMLSAYTEDSQLNLSFNAPSSSGKSYIPMEIAKLFPDEDVLELGYASPTSFFHSSWEFNKETNEFIVDLSRKIIVFLDQPHTLLLQHLRPLLSHDAKRINVQITDKGEKQGMRAKKIVLVGYPAVVFCSAALNYDEQETTRFLMLSPEINQEKLREGVVESLHRGADPEAYNRNLSADSGRNNLMKRIEAIKSEAIVDIRVTQGSHIERRFLGMIKILKPRHQRDIKRLVALIKIFALLNVWWRERDGNTISAEQDDVDQAFALWEKIYVTQELNIPPYVYRLYLDIILPACKEKNETDNRAGGITRQEMMAKHFQVYGRMINTYSLRTEILPLLTQAGLITEKFDVTDMRNKLIYPARPFGINSG